MCSISDSHLKENREQDHFDKLPDELVVHIFSHLSPEDIACHISKVCLRWQSIAKDPLLWETATLKYSEVRSLEFQETILFAPLIAKVHINMFINLTDDTIKSLLKGCKLIKYLSFYPGPEVPVDAKLNILSLYRENLVELNMFIDDSYLVCLEITNMFCSILGNMSNLKVLTLRGQVSSDLFKKELFQKRLGKLESLDISTLTILFHENDSTVYEGMNINPWQNFILLILDCNVQNIKKLSLPESVFDLYTVGALERMFLCSKVEDLKICEVGLRAVMNLVSLNVLHVVGLSSRNLDYLRASTGLQYNSLFDWISNAVQFSNVKELTLENIIDDDRRLTHHLLQACSNLDSLTISSGSYTSAHLAYLISKSTSIKTLSIHRMPCLKSKHLEIIMFYLPNLTVLNLQNNTLTDGILQFYVNKIQNKMPNLKLICDWGYWSVNGGSPWSCHSKTPTSAKSCSPLTATTSGSLGCDNSKVMQMLDALTDYEDDD